MDAKELRKQVNDIFLMASSMYVCGEEADTVAAVRSKLRKLYKDIGELMTEEKEQPQKPTACDHAEVPAAATVKEDEETLTAHDSANAAQASNGSDVEAECYG